jgi:sugar-specific transcriptional regulator TrmB
MTLGMTEREAKVFHSLLGKRIASASELQKYSGIPNSQIYGTIDSLVRQGYFIERQVSGKRTFEIVDPDLSLTPLLENLQSRLQDGDNLKQELAGIYANGEVHKEPFEYIEVVHKNDLIHRKFVELMTTAQFETLNFVLPPFAAYTMEMFDEQNEAYYGFLKRGGKALVLLEINDESHLRMYRLADINYHEKSPQELTRVSTKLPLKLFIFDRKTLLITEKSAAPDDHELTMTIIKQKTTVEGYVTLFNFMWDQAKTIDGWVAQNSTLLSEKMKEWQDSTNK